MAPRRKRGRHRGWRAWLAWYSYKGAYLSRVGPATGDITNYRNP
ncbi:hypothetical protein [Streptomyces collinus]